MRGMSGYHYDPLFTSEEAIRLGVLQRGAPDAGAAELDTPAASSDSASGASRATAPPAGPGVIGNESSDTMTGDAALGKRVREETRPSQGSGISGGQDASQTRAKVDPDESEALPRRPRLIGKQTVPARPAETRETKTGHDAGIRREAPLRYPQCVNGDRSYDVMCLQFL